MSLIGPRPDPLDDMDIYTEHQKRKLEVKPGITGYNQAYFRNSVEQNEKFENDVYYAEHVSFILDAKIFFKTIVMVLSHNKVRGETNNSLINRSRSDLTFRRFCQVLFCKFCGEWVVEHPDVVEVVEMRV